MRGGGFGRGFDGDNVDDNKKQCALYICQEFGRDWKKRVKLKAVTQLD